MQKIPGLKKELLITLVLLYFSFQLSAQFNKRVSAYIFEPGWYAGTSMGINVFVAEGFREYMVSKPLKTIGRMQSISTGYNFSPVFGIRESLTFAQHNWAYEKGTAFSAVNLITDFTVNLSNKSMSYNLNRRFDVLVYAGAGGFFRPKINSTSLVSYMARGGMQLNCHLNHILDLNFSGELNIASDDYNGFNPAGQSFPFDLYPAVVVGISYRFYKEKKM